jgi:hypothetical protein
MLWLSTSASTTVSMQNKIKYFILSIYSSFLWHHVFIFFRFTLFEVALFYSLTKALSFVLHQEE